MKKLVLLLVVVALLPACSTVSKVNPWSSTKNPGWYGDVDATLLRVVDGDTLIVTIHKYPPLFGENISVRLANINAPEPNEPGGPEAKAYVENLLNAGDLLRLSNMRRGKYFRIVADVRIKPGISLSDLLVQNNFAVRDTMMAPSKFVP